jgi:hypothetical protein
MALKGEIVVVIRPKQTGVDGFNDAVFDTTSESIEDVLVVPAATTDISDAARPQGHVSHFTLHFPKAYNLSLASCNVVVRGKHYKVIGNPAWYTPENTPGKWNYPVEVEAIDG